MFYLQLLRRPQNQTHAVEVYLLCSLLFLSTMVKGCGMIKGIKMSKEFMMATNTSSRVTSKAFTDFEAQERRKAILGDKVDHRGRVFTHIPAQMASAGPPLGSQLGQIGVNIANFVKDFNLKTSIFRPGVPIPSIITIKADRTHNLVMMHPPFQYFIKQAAGIQRGAMNRGEVSGMISRKQMYEIALLKSQDEIWQEYDMQVLCEKVLEAADSMGVKVVDELDAEEYEKFLIERKAINEAQLQELKEARESKLLRMASKES